jgi:tetratricopeptide (TPR) repeat protein
MTMKSSILRPAALALALFGAWALAGCRGGSTPGFNAAQEWERIDKQAQDLKAVRSQMEALRSQLDRWEVLAADPQAGGDRPSEPESALREKLDALRRDRYKGAATAFWDNLTLFLDRSLNDPKLKAAPETAKAVGLFAAESVALARDRIREEGRYDQAVEVLEQALRHAPDHAGVKAELAKARSFQRLTRERFDQAAAGLTMPAVRELCGVSAPGAVQQRTEKGRTLTAWLYPREDGNWAALFFQDGRLYEKSWDAQPRP